MSRMSHGYVNPQTQAVIDGLGERNLDDVSEQSIEVIREAASQLFTQLGPPPADIFKEEYIQVPGPAGDINCLTFTPTDPGEGKLPVLLYFIGGTFSHQSAKELGGTPSVLAKQANCIVVIPEHRIPPENPFPAGFEDCFAVYRWLLDNAGEIHGDVNRIAVGGGSSAGTHAAALCLDAKEAGIRQPVLQWLDVPFLDQIGEFPSIHEMSYLVDRASLRWGAGIHFGHDRWQEWGLRASPLRAPDLTGLAPAFITTAELDPLRDEGKAYAIRLRQAGVPCTHLCYEGQIHGFSGMGGVIDEGLMFIYQAAGVLRYAFDKAAA